MLVDHGGAGFDEGYGLVAAAAAFGTIRECQWARDLVALGKKRAPGLYCPMDYVDEVKALFALDDLIARAKAISA